MSLPKSSMVPLVGPRPAPWRSADQLAGCLANWRSSNNRAGHWVYDAPQAAREARFAPIPSQLHSQVANALRCAGRHKLYTHQAKAFNAVLDGHHIVIATPTASGKSLAYNLPVLDALVRDPDARALYMFPTKALSRDQEDSLKHLMRQVGMTTSAITYDGDTPGDIRRVARNQGGILLTNPDMLHSGILPYHTSWARFFSGLRYIVIDELHHYRGVFGSHLANVLRRLRRVASFYGAKPQFICASATIANAAEHAGAVIGEKVELVNNSGAPKGRQHIMVYNPPVVHHELGLRQSVLKATVSLTLDLMRAGVTTLVFGQSRNNIEVMLKYLRDGAAADPQLQADSIHSYRGGYLPVVRRKIEDDLRQGKLKCVVATGALELGIDIGSLQAVVCAGYPGSLAGLWQRFGRGGRRGDESLAVLVTSSAPLDQYFATCPRRMLETEVEHARIDPDNLEILIQHLKCAAFELPFTAEEPFGEVDSETVKASLEFLVDHETLHPVPNETTIVYHWAAQSAPATHVSLREIGWDNFVIIDVKENKILAEMDWRSAHTMLHEQAIYQHVACQYQVERLDFDNRKAFVRKVNSDYYTDAMTHLKLTPLDALKEDENPWPSALGVRATFGEVSVVEQVVGFKKIRYHTHENVGFGEVNLPEMQKHTTALWLQIAPTIVSQVAQDLSCAQAAVLDGLRGVAHGMRLVGAMGLMVDYRDLGSSVTDEPARAVNQQSFAPTVYLFDQVPGGTGLAARLFAERAVVMGRAQNLLSTCPCLRGCPSCVGISQTHEQELGSSRKECAQALLVKLGLCADSSYLC